MFHAGSVLWGVEEGNPFMHLKTLLPIENYLKNRSIRPVKNPDAESGSEFNLL